MLETEDSSSPKSLSRSESQDAMTPLGRKRALSNDSILALGRQFKDARHPTEGRLAYARLLEGLTVENAKRFEAVMPASSQARDTFSISSGPSS